MGANQKTIPSIRLSEDFETLVVQGPNIKVEICADGNVTVHSNGGVKTRPFERAAGLRMPNGSIYAGISPDTGRPMFATPKDAPMIMTFGQAAKYAEELDAHGCNDWRVPTKAELNELFENRVPIGRFDLTGSDPAGWYWSSSRSNYRDYAWAQRFRGGNQYHSNRTVHLALRCVRG